METKKYILGRRDQKWAWPKMGVANLKHGSKPLPGTTLLSLVSI
jgi:hypothetical protein